MSHLENFFWRRGSFNFKNCLFFYIRVNSAFLLIPNCRLGLKVERKVLKTSTIMQRLKNEDTKKAPIAPKSKWIWFPWIWLFQTNFVCTQSQEEPLTLYQYCKFRYFVIRFLLIRCQVVGVLAICLRPGIYCGCRNLRQSVKSFLLFFRVHCHLSTCLPLSTPKKCIHPFFVFEFLTWQKGFTLICRSL